MSKSQWIWFPGDREIWLGNDFNNRRTERGAMFPPFWKQDSHWQTVEFSKEFTLLQPDTLHIFVEGIYNFMVDGKLQFGQPQTWHLEAGEHRLNIKVHCLSAPPSLYIYGERPDCPANTDTTWRVTCEDKIWIDENGDAHGSGIYLEPGHWPHCDDPNTLPSQFELLQTVSLNAVSHRPVQLKDGRAAMLYDFGKETFGYILLHQAKGAISIFYGESEAEALDREFCETLDHLQLPESGTDIYRISSSKAFRYVLVVGQVEKVTMLYEYLPHDEATSGSFTCSDEELNRIWQVSAYTLDLTTREFMMDGIKRDRWTWSGDAIQSYLMNYYLRFDSEAVKRTIRQLRGKDPVTAHVNTILDYTFYWFNALGDYYLYTGDDNFIREVYPRAKTLMDYVLGRLTDEGLAIGQPDDWVFVDWVDFPMHKRGILCFEQILLYRSLQTMQLCANIVGDQSRNYEALAKALKTKTDQLFWDNNKKAYLHAVEEGNVLNDQITKFPNMMALLYDFVDSARSKEILDHVMLNADVPAITTPYMRFYELAALCQIGKQEEVLKEIKSYWGGMLQEGATSFWEKYNPTLSPSPQGADGIGRAHLEMYGRPYGKSLCHAWGASPLYLLGKYYLGVIPTQPGYRTYDVRPHLGGLTWMRGAVPTPFGPISISADAQTLTVIAPPSIGEGTIYWGDQCVTLQAGQTITLTLTGER